MDNPMINGSILPGEKHSVSVNGGVRVGAVELIRVNQNLSIAAIRSDAGRRPPRFDKALFGRAYPGIHRFASGNAGGKKKG